MAADAGEHDAPQIGFEQIVRLGKGVIEPRAFFKFSAVHWVLAEHHLGGVAALGPQGINVEDKFGRSADR